MSIPVISLHMMPTRTSLLMPSSVVKVTAVLVPATDFEALLTVGADFGVASAAAWVEAETSAGDCDSSSRGAAAEPGVVTASGILMGDSSCLMKIARMMAFVWRSCHPNFEAYVATTSSGGSL